MTDSIEALLDELVAAGVDVGAGLIKQSWGNSEVYVRDTSGNTIRFQSPD